MSAKAATLTGIAAQIAARPPRSQRLQPGTQGVIEYGGVKYATTRVTETEKMRNEGTSLVNSFSNAGWVKPEEPELLQRSPDGLSFNLVKPLNEVIEGRKRNDNRARLMEGFADHEMIADTSKEEDTVTEAELFSAIEAQDAKLAATPHDG